MAKCKAIGIDDYIKGLGKLSANIEPVLGRTIYEGAKVIADAIDKEIDSIPTRRGNVGEPPYTGLTEIQKKGLHEGLGVSTMQAKDGYKNVKTGFNGYNNLKTKKYPKGQPNVLIARSIVKGTSWLIKNDFISRAFRKVKSQAEETMRKTFDSEFDKHNK